LGSTIDCKLEFIPINIERLAEELNEGLYDIAMSAILISEERIEEISFTRFYTEQNNVLIVPIKKKSHFKYFRKVVRDKGLKIGATGAYKGVFKRHFPNATLVEGDLSTLVNGKADAWVWSHIPAFIWCLNYPQYTVIDYQGLMGKRYFAYATQEDAAKFLSFLNNWMGLQAQNGFTHEQYHYWILGEPPFQKSEPRWSIIRNILHWID
jgi:ABC-type amino acid transport substrate-binding protein